MMNLPDLPPEAHVTEITFTPPELADDDERMAWSLTVTDTGRGWAVRERGMYAYDAHGESAPEPSPSSRGDDHFARYRFPLPEALALAARILPTIRVNGLTAREVAAWKQERRAAKAAVESILVGVPVIDVMSGASNVWVWTAEEHKYRVIAALGEAGFDAAVSEVDVSSGYVQPEPGQPPMVRIAVVPRPPVPTFREASGEAPGDPRG